MSCWVFKDFLSNRGDKEVRLWLDGLPKKARIKIEKRLQYLSQVKKLSSEPQYMKPYKGYDDIFEIRIVCDGTQYRPLCCYGPEPEEVTLLIGAVEKDWALEPAKAADVAVARKNLILSGKGKVCDFFSKNAEDAKSPIDK